METKTLYDINKHGMNINFSLTDPHMMAARLSRAEAYMALKQYRLALEDAEFCSRSTCSAEVCHKQQFFKIPSNILLSEVKK